MSYSTCLSGVTTTTNIYQNVEFLGVLSSCQRLTNDSFQSLQSELLIDASFIYSNVAGSRYQINSGDGFLSSSGSIEFCLSHDNLPPSSYLIKMSELPVSERYADALHQHKHEVW